MQDEQTNEYGHLMH